MDQYIIDDTIDKKNYLEFFFSVDVLHEEDINEDILTEGLRYLLELLFEFNGEISHLILEVRLNRRNLNLNSLVDQLNSLSIKKYNQEFILYSDNTLKWEVDYFFNAVLKQKKEKKTPKQYLYPAKMPIERKETVALDKESAYSSSEFEQLIEKSLSQAITSYKHYWFLALKYVVSLNLKEITFIDMALIMCAFAWEDVLGNKRNFTKIDMLPVLINKLHLELPLAIDSKVETVLDEIKLSSSLFNVEFKKLTRYVPYRFLRIFLIIDVELDYHQPFKNHRIISEHSSQKKSPYRIEVDKIEINQSFIEYLQKDKRSDI